MTERGMKEGIEQLERKLKEMQKSFPDAFAAAGVTAMSRVLDATKPDIPRKTGELAESGFVTRTRPIVAGYGSGHAAIVHELSAGRGFKFYQRVLLRLAREIPAMQAELLERYAAAGLTPATAPSSYPESAAAAAKPARAPRARRRR